jgi:hypothetical protein
MLAVPRFFPLSRDYVTLSKWKEIRTALYQTGLDTPGKKDHILVNEDWFEENLGEMDSAVEAKRAAYRAHINNPCPIQRTHSGPPAISANR